MTGDGLVEFINRGNVNDWFTKRTREEIVLFSALNAAAVFPSSTLKENRERYRLYLAAFRSIHVALTSAYFDETDLVEAAANASGYTLDPADTATNAANFVANGDYADAADTAFSFVLTIVGGDESGIFSYANVIAQRIERFGRDGAIREGLWSQLDSSSLASDWQNLKSGWSEQPHIWGFWIDWYEGLLEGRKPDWRLWREIALIPDNVWKDGPEAVAKAIEAIKAKLAPPPLPPEVVTAQAKRLIAQPRTTALVGHDVASQIEDAITDYCRTMKLNALPAELERLHALPAILRAMAETSQSADRTAELEKQIVALVAQTVGLARDVQELQTALATKSASSLGEIAKEEVVKTTAKVFTTSFWGTVVVGISHFTGVVDFGSALEMLSGFGAEVEEIAPALENPVEQGSTVIDV